MQETVKKLPPPPDLQPLLEPSLQRCSKSITEHVEGGCQSVMFVAYHRPCLARDRRRFNVPPAVPNPSLPQRSPLGTTYHVPMHSTRTRGYFSRPPDPVCGLLRQVQNSLSWLPEGLRGVKDAHHQIPSRNSLLGPITGERWPPRTTGAGLRPVSSWLDHKFALACRPPCGVEVRRVKTTTLR